MAGASRLIDDLVRTASSAAGTVFGLRDEVEAQMRERFERILARADVVGRDEFEAVKEVAATARSEQETLAGHVAALEARLAALEKPATPAVRKAATGKTAVQKTQAEKPRARKTQPKKAPAGKTPAGQTRAGKAKAAGSSGKSSGKAAS